MSDEYAQATPEQKLNIATYFVMSAPVGEVDEVVAGQSDREKKKSSRHTRSQRWTVESSGDGRWEGGWRGEQRCMRRAAAIFASLHR